MSNPPLNKGPPSLFVPCPKEVHPGLPQKPVQVEVHTPFVWKMKGKGRIFFDYRPNRVCPPWSRVDLYLGRGLYGSLFF